MFSSKIDNRLVFLLRRVKHQFVFFGKFLAEDFPGAKLEKL